MPTALVALVSALPEVVTLLKVIYLAVDKQQTKKQIKEDFGVIQDAFANKDASKLNDLFNRR